MGIADISGGVNEVGEFGRVIFWYAGKKAVVVGGFFETGKAVVVEFLKARRGTYQKPFLHGAVTVLIVLAIISGPVVVNQYPTTAAANVLSSAVAPSAVLNTAVDLGQIETQTQESEKPRRDIEEYEVKDGDTLSSIAKRFGVDTESIAYLNDIPENKLLHPGDRIKIPPVSGVVVTVARGDTIYTLAKKHGLASAQPIVDWPYNTFVNDETFSLAAGQTLVIPGGKPPEVPIVPAPRTVSGAGPLPSGGGPFIWPVGGALTQYFSWYHHGLDIANSSGLPIAAADSGRVVTTAFETWGYGYHVAIDHGNGYRTVYAHLSRIAVGEGDNVARGQIVGNLGSTGRSTGPHLHFEVYQNGAAINPLGVLR